MITDEGKDPPLLKHHDTRLIWGQDIINLYSASDRQFRKQKFSSAPSPDRLWALPDLLCHTQRETLHGGKGR